MKKKILIIGGAGYIDDCIEQAMNIKERILNDNYHNALPLEKWWKI